MTNYLLSIDPSIKNTGFTLWEKECEVNCKYLWKPIETNTPHTNDKWKPILIKSFDFKKYDNCKFFNEIEEKIDDYCFLDDFDLIIERGTFHSKNGIGYETQEHLRGFIAGQFNKLLTKDMLISPRKWQNWYLKKYKFIQQKNNKWDKNVSWFMSEHLIDVNNWNITISNHDEADSLLIGWYYLNKENK